MTPRVAIVHDALVNAGGAERVVTFLAEAFPDAPIFTSAYLPERTYPEFRQRDVRVLPGAGAVRTEGDAKRRLPLWIWGFSRLNLSGFDAVLTSTTFAAKHVRPPSGVRHVSYCYAPFRLLWKPGVYAASSLPVGGLGQRLLDGARPWLRRFDRAAMQRPQAVATTCQNMAREIRECYGREARVIYAPVRVSDYRIGQGDGDYFLSVSRLISHKRVDLAVEACARLGRKLIVVGDGPERARLERLGGEAVTFAGLVDTEQLTALYAGCRALLFCSEEDYGLTPIEAQASGRPVIAYGAGGALETVVEGQSGIFFSAQTTDSLMEAMGRFERAVFDPARVRATVERFDVGAFVAAMREFVTVDSASR